MKSDICAELAWRGLIHQTTDDAFLPGWLRGGSRTLYVGFDPTADSLHVGSLMPLMALRRFQLAGHRPIALVGGATGMIGDPSGKSEERNLLSVETLRANVAGIEAQIRRFLDFDSVSNGALLVDNSEWMHKFGYLEFLRDVGKHFPVGVMLAKDSVKTRLGRDDTGLSYTEFSYMLVQAYDFVVLNRTHGCELQGGGSDQWGNITAGIDLARRMGAGQLYGFTFPLLLTSTGQKMGKTERGTIWLAKERTSPYAFYQYWINTSDSDAGTCLRFLTELPQEEIAALDVSRTAEPERRDSQRRLAESMTHLVHGSDGLAAAERATGILFGAEIDHLDDTQLLEIFADVPSKTLAKDRLSGSGLPLVEALVDSGLASSKSEARRTIEQGGAYINNRRASDLARSISAADLASETVVVLRSGRRKYALLRFS